MFHVIFLVPKDLINTSQITCKLEKLYPHNKHKLQYFNDKYVFIEVYDTIQGKRMKDSIATKILILNFEELLKENNCKEDSILKHTPKIKY
jgi:CO dehydrogenase/acetyl-CoA synthase gamma subunit (corrinoid Fe-S protein)